MKQMTNQEKAREIAYSCKGCYSVVGRVFPVSSYDECEQSAFEMAEWKDEQFIKFLEDRLGDEILVSTIEEFKKEFN